MFKGESGSLVFIGICVVLTLIFLAISRHRNSKRQPKGRTIEEHETFVSSLPKKYQPTVAGPNTICTVCGERGHFFCLDD